MKKLISAIESETAIKCLRNVKTDKARDLLSDTLAVSRDYHNSPRRNGDEPIPSEGLRERVDRLVPHLIEFFQENILVGGNNAFRRLRSEWANYRLSLTGGFHHDTMEA